MNTRKQYSAPELTTVTFRVENGFTGSNTALFNSFRISKLLQETVAPGYGDNFQQNWSSTEDLFGSGSATWD